MRSVNFESPGATVQSLKLQGVKCLCPRLCSQLRRRGRCPCDLRGAEPWKRNHSKSWGIKPHRDHRDRRILLFFFGGIEFRRPRMTQAPATRAASSEMQLLAACGFHDARELTPQTHYLFFFPTGTKWFSSFYPTRTFRWAFSNFEN